MWGIPNCSRECFNEMNTPPIKSASLDNPVIVDLVAQELHNSWYEHGAMIAPYINPTTLQQLDELLAVARHRVRELSKLKDAINKELGTGDKAEELVNNQKVTKEHKARLLELIQSRNEAEQAVGEFFATKEMCEGFLDYVGSSNFWLGFDETRKYQGLMEAIASINKFNFRIWGVKKDIDGNLIPNQVEYSHSFMGNPDSLEYKELFFTGAHFDRLSLTPGIFSSKELEARKVQNLEVNRSRDISVSNLPLSDEHSDKDVLGTMASFKASKETKHQSNNPSIVGNFTVTSGSSLGGVNRDKDSMQGAITHKTSGVFLPYSSGVVSRLSSGKSPIAKDQKTDTKGKDRRDVLDVEEDVWRKLTREEQVNLILLQEDKDRLKQQIAKDGIGRLKHNGEQTEELLKLQTAIKDIYKKIDSMGYEEFKKLERDYTFFVLKESSFGQPKFILTAFSSSKDSDQPSAEPAECKKTWTQKFTSKLQEFKKAYVKVSVEQDHLEEQQLAAQSKMVLDVASKVYNRCKENQHARDRVLRELYGEDMYDVDAYLHKTTWRYMLSGRKVNYDFNSGEPVLSNTIGIAIMPQKTLRSKGSDVIRRIGSESCSIGITRYESVKTKVNPLELKSTKLDVNAQGQLDRGINIVQCNSDYFNVDLNISTFVQEGKLNDLLSENGSNFSGKGRGAMLDTRAAIKPEQACVAGLCLQCEADMNLVVGAVHVVVDSKKSVDPLQTDLSSVKLTGKATCSIIKKPKPS